MQNITTTSSVEEITPQNAKNILEKNNSINRQLRKTRVSYYASQMKRGQWKLNGEAICFDREGNLTNGQHRLAAVVMADMPMKFVVVRNVEDGSLPTYDSGFNRSVSDIFKLSDILNSCAVSSVVRKCYLLGKDYSSMGVDSIDSNLSRQDIIDLYNLNGELYQTITNYSACLSNKLKLFSKSEIGGVMAHLVINCGYELDFVIDFCNILFQYNAQEDFKTCKLLRERLINASLRNERLENRYRTSLLAKTFNSYVEKKPLNLLKVSKEEGSIKFMYNPNISEVSE